MTVYRHSCIQEISNRIHWTDPSTWASNSSSNLLGGPLVRSHSNFWWIQRIAPCLFKLVGVVAGSSSRSTYFRIMLPTTVVVQWWDIAQVLCSTWLSDLRVRWWYVVWSIWFLSSDSKGNEHNFWLGPEFERGADFWSKFIAEADPWRCHPCHPFQSCHPCHPCPEEVLDFMCYTQWIMRGSD